MKKFRNLSAVIKKLKPNSDSVNRALLELIQKEKTPCFLLAAVLEFIERVDQEKILPNYTFNHFELWLNQFSGLDFEENRKVRGKIAGKWIERADYQALFPVGMGKVYEGTHFVTAHKSPDLDTTIASFWGWLDAFAARVGDGLHVWNVPDGPPSSQIEIEWLFKDVFGQGIFTHLPKTRTVLSLTGYDLVTQKGVQKRTFSDSIAEVDHGDQNAVIVVDEEGFYVGDWRAADVEGVRQVIISLSSCLRWFENSLHLSLISLFTKKELQIKDVEPLLSRLLEMKLEDCEPAMEFSTKLKRQVDGFMKHVLGMKKGLASNFDELAHEMAKLGHVPYGGVDGLIDKMKKANLFDRKGHLVDERPRIFSFLEQSVKSLHLAIVKIRARMEKLDVALKTKFEVFGHVTNTVSLRSEVEEIRAKMGNYPYLTVVSHDKGGFYPLGVIPAQISRKNILGTVSLRDFCNREEMGIPSYLEVISVIDHHKSSLQTFTPPMAIVSDAQSSNTLVALKAFEINDAPLHGSHFIHPDREHLEYLHFLYGIIDDTDLLSKVSAIDVQCVATLLNRLHKRKVVKIDDLPRDKNFPKKAAERILQNKEMYSLYSRVFKYREKEVEKNIAALNLFADTKEQNGCCRVGQTKIFAANIPSFEKHADEIRRAWLEKAMKIQKEKPEIDLHIHMISTIVNAEEVYQGTQGKYEHQDELWIWIPNTESGVEHLKRFLSSFQGSPGLKNNSLQLSVFGDELAAIFAESFLQIPTEKLKKGPSMAILKFNASSLNSRKAMVSPFLPTI
jgi:inorganic pyrophosphatase/exopolyphosphatase/DNA-binding MarR family transcriptional regulator